MARRMAILGFELEEIARLLTLVETQGLDELIYEEEGRYLRIRGPRKAKIVRTVAAAAPARPAAPPLVKVGDHIDVDQTVAIIEAMKVFSEFKSEYAGTILSIPAQDGQLVQTGAPLIVLKKD
jgi:acetyl-CoA carboxylase biotin carboxyl carrier protein